MDNLTLWLLFIAAGLGTFLVRLSFIQLHGSTEALIQRSKKILMLLPPAILAALCVPALVFTRPATEYQIAPTQLVAAAVTIFIAKYSRSVFWPVVGGMLCFWLVQYIIH